MYSTDEEAAYIMTDSGDSSTAAEDSRPKRRHGSSHSTSPSTRTPKWALLQMVVVSMQCLKKEFRRTVDHLNHRMDMIQNDVGEIDTRMRIIQADMCSIHETVTDTSRYWQL